jgi:predicted nucleotidyltransferase
MNVLNKQLLKKELLESPFIQLATKKLKPNDEVIAVLLAGSRAANLASETSDIDIAILTSNS